MKNVVEFPKRKTACTNRGCSVGCIGMNTTSYKEFTIGEWPAAVLSYMNLLLAHGENPDEIDHPGTLQRFKFCPYCSREIQPIPLNFLCVEGVSDACKCGKPGFDSLATVYVENSGSE